MCQKINEKKKIYLPSSYSNLPKIYKTKLYKTGKTLYLLIFNEKKKKKKKVITF